MGAKISLIPTPIGNLEDITLRSLRYLKECDLIAAEDTRTSGILLKHFEIRKELTSLHMHNEHKRVADLVQRVRDNELHLCVISDAGTPGISDPGYLMIRESIAKGVPMEVLPGATALIPGLLLSGFPSDSFVFEGFLPVKKGRKKMLEKLKDEDRTIVLYESPYKIARTLSDLAEYMGDDREVAICRELSKMFEEAIRGNLGELKEKYAEKKLKGEMVVVIKGQSKK